MKVYRSREFIKLSENVNLSDLLINLLESKEVDSLYYRTRKSNKFVGITKEIKIPEIGVSVGIADV